MKYIIFIILVLTSTVNAKSYLVKHYDTNVLNQFMQEFSVYVEKPLNWCNVTLKKVNDIADYDNTHVYASITVNIDCESDKTSKQFNAFIKKYTEFMNTSFDAIDSAIAQNYPQVILRCGHHMNGTDWCAIQNNVSDMPVQMSNTGKEELGDNVQNRKVVLFSAKIGNYTSNTMIASFYHGTSIMDELELTTVDVPNKDLDYTIIIPKENFNPDNLNITLSRVWKFQKNASYISSGYAY